MIFEARIFDVNPDIDSMYVGEPRPELDSAWHDLLQSKLQIVLLLLMLKNADQNIQVSADEMRKLGRLEEGVELPTGGYFASLMVYHQLHCLKRLHHFTYQEHYFPNMSQTEMRHNRLHNCKYRSPWRLKSWRTDTSSSLSRCSSSSDPMSRRYFSAHNALGQESSCSYWQLQEPP